MLPKADLADFAGLDGLICGIPTWNTGAEELRSGTAWDELLEKIGELDLKGKPVAVFGLGDSVGYGRRLCRCNGRTTQIFRKSRCKNGRICKSRWLRKLYSVQDV